MNVSFSALGDHAIVIECGQRIDEDTHDRVMSVVALLEACSYQWMDEFIPAFTTITIFYDPVVVMKMHAESTDNNHPYQYVQAQLQYAIKGIATRKKHKPRKVEIPVCYGGDFGPDLTFVAKHNGITEQAVIDSHSRGEYLVYMIGFAPGFPYIGGMSEKIAAPRRASPRSNVPAGTVGIAGKQTGVYPIKTPGGWQLIGRTPLPLFKARETIPSLLQAGDEIHFKAITLEEFYNLEARQ